MIHPEKITVELIGGPSCGNTLTTDPRALRINVPFVGYYAYESKADVERRVMRWQGPGVPKSFNLE